MIEHNWEKMGNMFCVLNLKLGGKRKKNVGVPGSPEFWMYV